MSMLAVAQIVAAIAITQGSAESTSGGALQIEQAAYDVLSYDVSLKIDPAKKSISGTTMMVAKIVVPTGRS